MLGEAKLGAVSSFRIDTFSVSVQFSPDARDPWWLICVYVPQGNNNKIAFLNELRHIRSVCLGPWLLGVILTLFIGQRIRTTQTSIVL